MSERTVGGLWMMPVVVGSLSAVGLTIALFFDGPGDVLSWVALGIPTAIAVYYGFHSRGTFGAACNQAR